MIKIILCLIRFLMGMKNERPKNKNPGNLGVVGMLAFRLAPQHGLEPRT